MGYRNSPDAQEIFNKFKALLLNRSRKSVKEKLNDLGYAYHEFITKEVTQCLQCSNTIPIGYKFCNHSCAATYTNKLRKNKRFCAHCDCEIIGTGKKFCSRSHQQEFYRDIIFKKIEAGVYTTTTTKVYKDYLLSKFDECCMLCGWNKVNQFSNKIPLELHHIDFNPDNNKVENLQLLCPNCHSLTNNWKGIRKGEGRDSKRRIKRREKYSLKD